MTSRSLAWLAILGEGLLVVIALVWARWREMPLALGGGLQAVLMGCTVAAAMGAANLYLLRGAPDLPGVRSIRRLYVDALMPLFARVSATEVVIISLAAGVGEELFFRGILQPEIGIVPASVLFGLLHMGGSGTLAFVCWAMLMGGALGVLALWTGGLVAPIVAHAVYDAAAMSYIRWGGAGSLVIGCGSARAGDAGRGVPHRPQATHRVAREARQSKVGRDA